MSDPVAVFVQELVQGVAVLAIVWGVAGLVYHLTAVIDIYRRRRCDVRGGAD